MNREHVVMFCYCDIAGQVRGKGFPASDLQRRLKKGVGWTPTNIQLTSFGPIADTPWGPFGDLALVPDPTTEVRLDFGEDRPREHFFLSDVQHMDGSPWACCPRTFLKRALEDLENETGLRVLSSFEHEFYYEGAAERPGSGYNLDALRRQGIFSEVFIGALRATGVEPDSYLPEYGPRQYEVTCAPAQGVTAADRAVILREVARATAQSLGHHLTFSPVVTPDVVGNGVHVHLSLLGPDGQPAAYDPARPHGVSEVAGRFVAGLLRHARALCAITAPSVVSYLRLIPHRWSAAWTNFGWRDREACVRICPVSDVPGAPVGAQFNIEFRAADAAASPYFVLGALVRAGLEGIRQQLPPPEARAVDPETMGEGERSQAGIVRLPRSLEEALDALASDTSAKAWFPEALLDVYMRHKRAEIGIMAELDPDERCRLYSHAY